MSIVRSFATGLGDTYYIEHNSDNFTIIDCRIPEDRDDLVEEICERSAPKGITRFISTHPDDDHIRGLVRLDDALEILNFYVVKNEATKPEDTVDFARYCELRDSSKAFYLEKGCSRKWMNVGSEDRSTSGLSILWPKLSDPDFKNVLASAKDGGSPNNLSIILKYSIESSATMLWFGDLETAFMETIEDRVDLPQADVVFAAHHGRAKMPASWIDQLDPRVIVIGEAPKEHLEYYDGRDHLRQNTAGDITFDNRSGRTHVYVGNPDYEADFLSDEGLPDTRYGHYLGSLAIGDR
jgi:Metallo-beta-lactamase superfamily